MRLKKWAADRLLPLLVIPWLLGATWLLSAEFKALGTAPGLIKKNSAERHYKVSGPLYKLSREIESKTPRDARLFFINPSYGSTALFYTYRLRYYLYPRNFIALAQTDPLPADLRENDFIIAMLPAKEDMKSLEGLLDRLSGAVLFEEAHSEILWNFSLSIFRIKGKRIGD